MSNLATIVNNILADSGIDDINVVVTTGSYANPAWITSLAWSKITGAPSFVTGSGTTNRIPKFTGASTIGDSLITDNGTTVNISLPLTTTSRIATGNVGDQAYASIFIGGDITSGTNQYAILLDPQLSGSGDNYGLFANARIRASTAVNNAFGVYIPSAEKLSGATIVNNYALYIANQTSGSSVNYSIYSSGGLNYFGGSMGIGATPIADNKFYLFGGNLGINGGNFRLGNEVSTNNEAFEFYKFSNILRVYRNSGAFGGTYNALDVNFDLYDGTDYNVRISGAGLSYLKTLSVGSLNAPSLGNSVRMANGFEAYITSGSNPDRSYIIDTNGTGQLDFVSYPTGADAYSNSIGIFKPFNPSGKDLLLMSGDANIRFVTGAYTEAMRVTNSQTVNIGNTTNTTYKFYVNGTSYFQNTITANDNIVMSGGEFYYGGTASNRFARTYVSGSAGAGTLNFSFFDGTNWNIRQAYNYSGSIAFTGNSRTLNINTTTRVLDVIGTDSFYGVQIKGGSTAGQSFGLLINAGTNTSDTSFLISNKAETLNYFQVRGDGQVVVGSGTASNAMFAISAPNTHFSYGNNQGATFNIQPASTGEGGVNLNASYWTGTGYPYINFVAGGNNAFRITPSKEFWYYSEDNATARANIYYQLATNEYRIYATNGSGATTGVKLMEYNGSTYYQVLTTNTGLSLTGGTLSGALSVNSYVDNYVPIGPNDDIRTGLLTYDSTTMAAGVGGQLVLGYKYTSGGDYTQGAIIKMYKLNGTSGDYSSGIRFQVRNTGDGLSTKMTLDPSGRLGIGITPQYPLHVKAGSVVGSRFIVTGTYAPIQFSGDDSVTLGALNAYADHIVIGRGTSTGVTADIAIQQSTGKVSIGWSSPLYISDKLVTMAGPWRANITSGGQDRCEIRDTNGSQIDLVSYIPGGEAYSNSIGMFVNGGKDALIMAGSANIRFVTGGYTEVARATNGQEFWIGYTSDQGSYKLQVNGSTYSSSGFFESSDIRLKTILNRHQSADFDAIEYNWNDGRDSKLHWGYAAQEVMNVLPDAVNGTEELFYTLDYNQVHTYKIAMLEKRIVELEKQLKNK